MACSECGSEHIRKLAAQAAAAKRARPVLTLEQRAVFDVQRGAWNGPQRVAAIEQVAADAHDAEAKA